MRFVKWALVFILLFISAFAIWVYQLQGDIQDRIHGQWFVPPIEFYASGKELRKGLKTTSAAIRTDLDNQKFRKRQPGEPLNPGDYVTLSSEDCDSLIPKENAETIPPPTECLAFESQAMEFGPLRKTQKHLVAWDDSGAILGVWQEQPNASWLLIDSARIPGELFAQFYGEEPILRQTLKLEQTPLTCIQALLAIEDNDFLEHKGVSISGVFRALLRNLRGGRLAQGGSTITQQLVKNYFLSSEKTMKRKIKEMVMAVLLESQISKDQILENYLNVIYMGQNGSFQVRGYGAAAEHYFGRSLEDLGLSDCALMAAIVNSPGLFNPFTQPERSTQRRNLVLKKMQDLELVEPSLIAEAMKAPLPTRPPTLRMETAPYFVDAVLKKIRELNINLENGLRIFTTLDRAAQDVAQRAVAEEISALEERNPKLKKIKESKKDLEGLLISADVASGGVRAIVGGRSFRKSQFNRAIVGHRQVGSVIKPFVYLTALETKNSNGDAYNPLTIIPDEAFQYKEKGQSWSPVNYDHKYHGQVPLYYALKNSFNSSTAKLGLDLGISSVIDLLRRVGVTSRLEPYPSLSLGAFELYPWEVTQAYLTLARMGNLIPLHWVESVEDLSGHVLFDEIKETTQVVKPQAVAVLTGMLKQTILSGTATLVPKLGFTAPAAGKTGTTSDTKDAWFAGFTPYLVTVAWVGYDDNTPHGLTGASGAIPLWARFMREYSLKKYDAADFIWPENVTAVPLDLEKLQSLLPEEEQAKELQPTEMVFENGTEP
jgi:penicillin-binding protein 1B